MPSHQSRPFSSSAGDGNGAAINPNSFWKILGNAAINENTNFLGTLNDAGVLFRTNNLYRGQVSKAGNFLWNTDNNSNSLVRVVGDFSDSRYIILNTYGAFGGSTGNPHNPGGQGGQIAHYINPAVNHSSGTSWGVLIEPAVTAGEFRAFSNTSGDNRFNSEGGRTIVGGAQVSQYSDFQVNGESTFGKTSQNAGALTIAPLVGFVNDTMAFQQDFMRFSVGQGRSWGAEFANYLSITGQPYQRYSLVQVRTNFTNLTGGETNLQTLRYGKFYNSAGSNDSVVNNLLIAPFYKQEGGQNPSGQYNAIKIEEGDLFLNSNINGVDYLGEYKFRPVNIVLSDITGSMIATSVAQKMGFWGATPVPQQPVTGSRADGTALTNLLTTLATIGVINNQTTV